MYGIFLFANKIIFNRWNKEKLVDAFTSSEDREKLLKEAGVHTKLEKKPSSSSKKVRAITNCWHANSLTHSSIQYKCLICEDEVLGKNTYALGCGHRYCLDCWKSYLEVAIKEGAECVLKRCPSPKCNIIVHDKAYKRCVSKQAFQIYKRYLNRSLVTDNPQVRGFVDKNVNFSSYYYSVIKYR